VLLIDDDPAEARKLRELLAALPDPRIVLDWADGFSSGLDRLSERRFDAVMLGLKLFDVEGLVELRTLRARFPSIPVILLAGLAEENAAAELFQEGAQDLLPKEGLTGDALVRSIRFAFERQRAERDVIEREAQLRRLQAVTDSTLVHLVPNELPAALLGPIRDALAADASAIVLHDQPRGVLVRLAAWGLGETAPDSTPVESQFAAHVVAAGRTVAHADLTGCPGGGRQMLDAGIRAVVGTPLLTQGRVLGAVVVGMSQPHPFKEDEVQFLEAVAQRIAPAIELALAHQEHERAVEMRDHVLALVAHDLKAPLASIRARVQMLHIQASRARAGKPASSLIDQVARIEQTTMRMANLVNDLADASQSQLGKSLEMNRSACDLAEIVRFVVADVRAQYGGSTYLITCTVSGGPFVGMWDQPRLERVVRNLLDNALKYSPGGGRIAVGLRRIVTPRGAWASLTVRDHGLGIPRDEFARIFEPFHRGTNVAGKIQGTGLGLASAREVVKLHGGSIAVRSRQGLGSVFTVRLPIEPVRQPE